MRRTWFLAATVLVALCPVATQWRQGRRLWNWYPVPRPYPFVLQRPPGMAPVAFDAFVRACRRARVENDRIGQTIGDHPLSHGYHKADGVVLVHGAPEPYCAATDLGVWGLNAQRIAALLAALQHEGFACWYRHGGKWTGDEHIHAIYMHLPMKPQLRRQVRQFEREHGLRHQPLSER